MSDLVRDDNTGSIWLALWEKKKPKQENLFAEREEDGGRHHVYGVFSYISEALLLHWSNIVGATHTDDYRIWEYDQYASAGVKQVCEFGYSSSLETDMKRNVSRSHIHSTTHILDD